MKLYLCFRSISFEHGTFSRQFQQPQLTAPRRTSQCPTVSLGISVYTEGIVPGICLLWFYNNMDNVGSVYSHSLSCRARLKYFHENVLEKTIPEVGLRSLHLDPFHSCAHFQTIFDSFLESLHFVISGCLF